jgi:hypothetical protein
MPEEPIDFIEESPSVWKVAPESQDAMESQLDAALKKANLPSLDKLRRELLYPSVTAMDTEATFEPDRMEYAQRMANEADLNDMSDNSLVDTWPCPKGHGNREILESSTYTGFAGGTCYWMMLDCGCCVVDESDDVRAAE